MTRPEGWNAQTAIANLQPVRWRGHVWRFHRRRYAAADPGGSLLVSGRYHCASDQFAEEQTWPALYLALSAEVALGEILRHISPELLANLNEYRVSELEVEMENVLQPQPVHVSNR